MHKRIFITAVLAVTGYWLQAQLITVSGHVIAEEDNSSLIGVNIQVKGTARGTTTGLDGDFSLEAAVDDTLLVSYIGYESMEVPVAGRSQIEIRMSTSTKIIDEVVVTGYRKEIKANVSSAISSIKAEKIEELPVLGLEQALQGQVAGIQVTQKTGAPGDDIAVRIRGSGTFGNNNPLYIIDGVPTTGNINMFSITDIESIEVLKDGASASIYGARAANGVILITTKKGSEGRTKFHLNTYYGVQEANRLPDLLNAEQYLSIRNEAIENANELRDPIRQLETYDPAILQDLPDIDWLDEVFRTAPTYRVSLSASGGSDNGNFYVTGEYFTQDGVFERQSFDRYMLRFNGQLGNEWLKVGNNLSISYTDRQVIESSGDGAGPGNELSGIRYALIAAPVFPKYDENGDLVPTSALLGDPILYGDGNANPVAFINATNWNVDRYRVFGNAYLDIEPLENLHFRTNLGTDLFFGEESIFKERLSAAIYDPTSLSRGNSNARTLIWNNTLTYNFRLGADQAHHFDLLLGHEVIDNHTEFLGASASNFFLTDPNFRFIDNSINEEVGDIGASGIATEWGLLSWFGQLGYNYKGKYIFNASVRRDGSSRFGPENRYGTFPAVSAAWNISSEPFMQNLSVISHLKLRASWGQLGNQEIGIYPYSSRVETGIFSYPFGGQIATGAEVIETGNPNIKWETTTQTDIGLEMSLWKDRLSLVADYYIKRTEDILVRVPLPQSAGAFNPPFVNAGEIENRGFELGLNYRNSTGNFRYQIGGNLGTLQNEVLSIAGTEPLLGGFGLSDGPITRTEPGHPIGSFYLYEMLGIFQTQEEIDNAPFQSEFTRPGDVRFADLNGDDVINDEDRAHLGDPFPDLTYALNASMQYKNFDLSLLLQGVQGNDVYFLYGNFAYETQLRGFNSYAEILDRWTPDNPGASIPRVSLDDRNSNRRISTRFLEDGSYLRVRNLTIGYDFSDLITTGGIADFRLYVSAQNLFTITDYSGLDPEIQANSNDTEGFGVSSDLAVGIDWGTVPSPRIFLIGLDVNF